MFTTHSAEEKQSPTDADSNDITSYFSSISQLALANKLTLDPHMYTETENLFLEFNQNSSNATPQDIIIVLSSIAHLVEKGNLQNIGYVIVHLDKLIEQVIRKRSSLKESEIADLIWTLSSYVKNKKLSEVHPGQIAFLFTESQKKHGNDPECMGKILSSMSRLIEHRKIESQIYIHSLLNLFIRLSNHPDPSSYAITCGLWSLKQLVLFQNIQIPEEDTKKLISQLAQLHFGATTQEIADSLWAIVILVSTEAITLSQNELIQIMGFKDALEHHESSIHKEYGLSALNYLRSSQEKESIFTIHPHASEVKEEHKIETGSQKSITKKEIFSTIQSTFADAESLAKYLLSLTKLLEAGKLSSDQIDPSSFKEIFDDFYLQVKRNKNILTSRIVDSVWAFTHALRYGLAIKFDTIGKDIDNIEFLIHCIASRENATSEEILRIYKSIEILISFNKLKHTAESVKHFAKRYRSSGMLFEEKESEDKLDSIVLQPDCLAKVITDTAATIKQLTRGKNVFLGGTGAADAAIPEKEHTSDNDFRIFDLTEEDIENLYQHFNRIAKPGTCKKISGKHPLLQFELENNGKTYFIQIVTSWKKNPGETDEEAMFRKTNTGGINLECLYIPLTANSPSLELKGSSHDTSTFKNKKISLRNVKYFADDPLRALRILKKEMDYNKFHFEPSTELKAILRDKKFKSRIYDYLLLDIDKENNQIRFANKLQSLSSEYGLYNLVLKMNNSGIINAIINSPDLTFTDLKETLTCLRDYDQKPFTPADQQTGLSYFLLAHFCAKIKYMHPELSSEEKMELLNKWQLKEFIWRFPNPDYAPYQDYIVRKWLNTPTRCKENVSEIHFLAMLSRVDEYYEKCAKKSNMPNYAENNNPLFTRNRHYQSGYEQMRPRDRTNSCATHRRK